MAKLHSRQQSGLTQSQLSLFQSNGSGSNAFDLDQPLFRIREGGRYGFINAQGDMAIEPQFLEAEDFYNGFSRVLLNDRLVPMDKLGRLLMKRMFN